MRSDGPATATAPTLAGLAPDDLSTASLCLQSGHIGVLDGVRGLAILLVLVYHFTLSMAGQTLPGRLFFRSTAAGWCGVDLFFVLSGFLITGILYDAKDLPHRFRNFYARRALRIFPLYYTILAITFALLPRAVRLVGRLDDLEDARFWLWTYGTNVYVAFRGDWFPLSHFWSLAVEEHFYLFWPAIIIGCDRKTALRVCGAMIVMARGRAGLVGYPGRRHGRLLLDGLPNGCAGHGRFRGLGRSRSHGPAESRADCSERHDHERECTPGARWLAAGASPVRPGRPDRRLSRCSTSSSPRHSPWSPRRPEQSPRDRFRVVSATLPSALQLWALCLQLDLPPGRGALVFDVSAGCLGRDPRTWDACFTYFSVHQPPWRLRG